MFVEYVDEGFRISFFENSQHKAFIFSIKENLSVLQDSIYSEFLKFSSKMSSGSMMVSLMEAKEKLSGDTLTGNSITTSSNIKNEGQVGDYQLHNFLDGYQFGSRPFAPDKFYSKLSNKQIVENANKAMMSTKKNDWPRMDEIHQQFVGEFTRNNGGGMISTNFRFLTTLLLINRSSSVIIIYEERKNELSEYHVIDSPDYDKEAKALNPGGAALFVGWGHISTVVRLSHANFLLDTNAFQVKCNDFISTSTDKPGFVTKHLEKTLIKRSHSKYVVVCEDAK